MIVANDGLQAWDILQRDDAPRLAILDWMMPGMDGPQVCRQVRSQGQERYIYILLLTAKRQRQDIVEGMEAGADDYITKPFDSQELRARLRAAGRILDLQSRLLSTHESLRDQATHDSLTGLPNRLLFGDRLADRLEMARRHNDSNVLCLGGRILSEDEAWAITEVWLETPFEGGRHERRVALLDDEEPA